MGYQALLFCPDEKTARTVTQVLGDLEFSVEVCTEPFAAVKKLMGEHFDALVVDCDNEQNATLLFKSARNSASNQSSLAVAVVEGQAGVAKAFRIGANLVLTRPINVEQAKGTLRVARGLLRKGDPGRGASPNLSPATQSSAVAPPAPPKTSPQAPTSGMMPPRSDAPSQPVRPFASASTAPTAGKITRPPSAVSAANDDEDVIDIDEPATSAPSLRSSAAATSIFKTEAPLSNREMPSTPRAPATITSPKDTVPPMSTVSSGRSGTGSAAAPARSPQRFDGAGGIPSNLPRGETLVENPADGGKVGSSTPVPAPSFSFGGANSAEEPAHGGSKRALIAVAAIVVLAVGLYAGWTQFRAKVTTRVEGPKSSETAPPNTASTQAPAPTAPLKPVAEAPSSAPSLPAQPTSQPTAHKLTEGSIPESNLKSPNKTEVFKATAKTAASASDSLAKSSFDAKPAPQPIVVKNGTVPPTHVSPTPSDTAAPSVLGIAPSSSGGSLSNLLGNPAETSKPVLQTLTVSQGVSQGLLIKKVQPTYPPASIRMHVEGSVRLLATVGKTGDITAVKILSGEPLLALSAVEAVKQWKYKPYYLNGDPVEIQTQVTINFNLPR